VGHGRLQIAQSFDHARIVLALEGGQLVQDIMSALNTRMAEHLPARHHVKGGQNKDSRPLFLLIDFGLRNPFAAVWGTLDRDGVLWLYGEHYSREKPLAYHVKHLPRDVTWYGDPAGAREIVELRCAGVTVRKGDNSDVGIMAVRSRLENGTLRILTGTCPNLLAEAELYRYDPEATDSEKPVKEYDHALDAVRYLISKLDAGKVARMKKHGPVPQEPGDSQAPEVAEPQPRRRKYLSYGHEDPWTPLR